MSSERAVAIVGLGATLPDAPNAPAFRDNVWGKRYSIIEVPPERWKADDYFDPDPSAPDKTYSKIGSWVRGFEFDWKRFKIPPKVAEAMDEGQQWAVTIAAEALADYGWPERPLDTERTAVILGNAMAGEHHYLTTLRIQFPECARWLNDAKEFGDLPADVRQKILSSWHERMDATLPPVTEDTMPGELANILSGRVANVLNLRGPKLRDRRRLRLQLRRPRRGGGRPGGGPLRRGDHRRHRPQHGRQLLRQVLQDRGAVRHRHPSLRGRGRRVRDGRGLGRLRAEAPGRRRA